MSSNSLLDILDAHGRDFLDSFELPAPKIRVKRSRPEEDVTKSKKRKMLVEEESLEEDSEEEWGGITTPYDAEQDFDQEDDAFVASSSSHTPAVVVFSDTSSKPRPSASTTKAQMKAFMSSKVSKLSIDVDASGINGDEPDDKDDERTNVQNDAILHKLVHTKLLSGSLNSELDLTPAHRRKALAGRVLELSGEAKLGQGEKIVRATERNKAAKRVRLGIVEKQKERGKQHLQEAKDLGNYHPTIKKLFESTSAPTFTPKRDRGLKMGVGKFTGGVLKLSRDEIDAVNNSSRQGSGFSRGGRGRGKGASRGRGAKRGKH